MKIKPEPHTLIWIRGAGEIGSATAVSLTKAGFNVILSEINPPLAIRRSVTFSDAVIDGETSVAGILGKLINIFQFDQTAHSDFIPVFIDEPENIHSLSPTILIDARMIKSYDDDYRGWAKHVIGFGPGFIAKQNCHAVIETMRGHNLGRIIYDGYPMENTDIPEPIGGQSKQRVLYAPSPGKLKWEVGFGDILETEQIMGFIGENVEVRSPFRGMVRGLIHPSVPMAAGLKIADVDPRGDEIDFNNLSDKARSLGRAALEASMIFMNKNP
ncbi:MAG: EF2563 family selenium-dependent molybdenum hydroxylase system protein [Candidatus Marinimicrobia bacterium]|nr:EF2563 family selenium-dependent molybdenum hydroxylase system protein [Candidatus Neomarinimicrobiota bacterium]